jgi:CDP-glycerol glycerophosphotransferase (TagB/SpsB family)
MHMSFLKLHSWAHNLYNTALSVQWHHTVNQTYQKLISSSQHLFMNTLYRQRQIYCIPTKENYVLRICRHDGRHHGSAVLVRSGWSSTYLWAICYTHGPLTVSLYCEVYCRWTEFICTTLGKVCTMKTKCCQDPPPKVLFQ